MADERCSQVSIEKRLERAQFEILEIKRRFFFFRALQDDLNAVTRGKPFRIHNDVLWMVLLDSRDMMVVHLASWCRATYRPGGLFGQLRALHLPELRRNSDVPTNDPTLNRLTTEALNRARSRLFPNATSGKIRPEDVDSLKDAFQQRSASVIRDRDTYRAHAWEARGTASAKMLDIDEVGSVFEYVESVLNDIRLVTAASTMASTPLTVLNPQVVAEDLLDQVLVGHLYRLSKAVGDRSRDDFYAELHRRHDESDGRALFNDHLFRSA